MNVPPTPTTTTERAATQISPDQPIKSELIPPLSMGLFSKQRHVLRSSTVKNTDTCGRTSVTVTAAYSDITTSVQMPSSIRVITVIASGDSNNKISNDLPKKRKSADATTGSTVSTNDQCIVSDDDESILNKKKKKKDVTIKFNTSTNTSNPTPTAISTKNVGGKRIRSSVSSTSSSSPSSLISQAQIHSKKHPFPHKLYNLMADVIKSGSTNVISWSADGTGFIVHDHARFASEFLPTYFGHNQMRSFDRQLNYWEFERINAKKVTNKSFGGKSWKHPFFQKDRRDLLKDILRRKIKSGPASTRRYTFNDGDDKKKKKDKKKKTSATKINKKKRMEEVLESAMPGPTHVNVRKNILLKIQSINRREANLVSTGLRRNITNPVVNQESSSSSSLSSKESSKESSSKESSPPLPESKIAPPMELRRNINLGVNQESSLSSTSSSSSKESSPPLPESKFAPPLELRRNINLVVIQESSLSSTSSSPSSSSEEEESFPPLPEYVRTPSEMIATALYEEANKDIEDEFLPLLPIDCFNDVDGDGDGDHKDKDKDKDKDKYKDKNEDRNNKHNSTNNTDGGMVYQWNDDDIVFGGKSFHDVKLGGNDNDNNENNDDDDDDDDEAMSTLMSIILRDEEGSTLLPYKDDINEICDSSFSSLFDLTTTTTTLVH
jgi:hypothetical protein